MYGILRKEKGLVFGWQNHSISGPGTTVSGASCACWPLLKNELGS